MIPHEQQSSLQQKDIITMVKRIQLNRTRNNNNAVTQIEYSGFQQAYDFFNRGIVQQQAPSCSHHLAAEVTFSRLATRPNPQTKPHAQTPRPIKTFAAQRSLTQPAKATRSSSTIRYRILSPPSKPLQNNEITEQ
jgi:hypothetical protein